MQVLLQDEKRFIKLAKDSYNNQIITINMPK